MDDIVPDRQYNLFPIPFTLFPFTLFPSSTFLNYFKFF